MNIITKDLLRNLIIVFIENSPDCWKGVDKIAKEVCTNQTEGRI